MNDFPERQEFFANVPIHQFLGMHIIRQSKENAVVEMDVSSDYTQDTGVVHGGIISTLADATAANLFQPFLPDDRVTTSIEFKMNFLRPVLADKGKLRASAIAIKRGRKVGIAEVEVFQAESLVAKGLFTYLIVEANDWVPRA